MHKNHRETVPLKKAYKLIYKERNPYKSDYTEYERTLLKRFCDGKLRVAYRQWFSNQDWDTIPDPLPEEVDNLWYYS